MNNSNSPSWEFDDDYNNLDEVVQRVSKTILHWKNDLQTFHVIITRLNSN